MEDQLDVILSGITGSTAYGLATPASDIDMLGVYVLPTLDLVGFHPPTDASLSQVQHEPDITVHEVGKYCRLAARANPTILELLWLDGYHIATQWGMELIAMRHEFLCAQNVRNSYFGYATQQLVRMVNRTEPGPRAEKNARHIWRLLKQGLELYSTGQLTIKLHDVDVLACREFGVAVAKDPQEARILMGIMEDRFDNTKSPLPQNPNVEQINAWLRELRKRY